MPSSCSSFVLSSAAGKRCDSEFSATVEPSADVAVAAVVVVLLAADRYLGAPGDAANRTLHCALRDDISGLQRWELSDHRVALHEATTGRRMVGELGDMNEVRRHLRKFLVRDGSALQVACREGTHDFRAHGA